MNEWIGFGPSASSQYNQVRRKNFSNIGIGKITAFEESLEYEEY